MKKVLVVGGYGFIGTNLLKYIDQYFLHLYSVIVFDRFNSHPHNIQFECVTKTYSGDFSDEIYIEKVFQENKIDIVIHALSSTVPVTSKNSRFDIESNLISTINLLDTMVKFEVFDIVFISTGGAIYGESLLVHNESDDVFPISSYGVVKLAIEKYMFLYSSLFGINPLVLRLSNPFGKYHYNEKQGICNIALRKALKGETIDVWGNGDGKKDYIYIDDFCNIIFKLLSKGISRQIINVASGQLMSINQIINNVSKIVPEVKWNYVNQEKVDVTQVELDRTKLLHYIGSDFKYTEIKKAFNLTKDWQIMELNR